MNSSAGGYTIYQLMVLTKTDGFKLKLIDK